MNCIHCERPAHGICRFCGRAICKDHFKTDQAVDALILQQDQSKMKGLVVENVLRCGLCRPVDELVDIDIK